MNPEQIGKNIAKRILIEEFTEKVVLYPGAFKPPHRGHVATILGSNNEFIDKYIVFVSTKTRDDVEVAESLKAWNLYKQTIPGLENVEFVPTATPVKAVYDYANENPTHDIRAVFGKGEGNRFDRLKDPENYPNVEIFDAGTEGDYSATGLRQAIRDKDVNKIQTIIPADINPDSFLNIFDQVSEAIYPRYSAKQVQRTRYQASDVYTNDPDEIIGEEQKIHCKNCDWSWKVADGGDDLYMCHKCGHDNTPRKTENKYLQEARYKSFLNEQWEDQKAHVINHFTDYATNYLSIDRPKIKVITDPQYTQMNHSFGGYMPSTRNISVVVHNRNMADILRTLAHELVHHMQNLDDRLKDNSGEDGSPEENEANSLAAVIMRQYGRENSHIYE
jgi:hypothetical protein